MMLRTLCLLMIVAVLCSSYPSWGRSLRQRMRPKPAGMSFVSSYKRADPFSPVPIPLVPSPSFHRSSPHSVPLELFVPPFVTYEAREEEGDRNLFRGFPMML